MPGTDEREAEDPLLRVVFLGTPEAAVPTLSAVHRAGHRIPLVVTRPDRRRGRGGRPGPSPVKEAALEYGLPVHQPEDVNAPESVKRIRSVRPDVLLIVAYGRILKRPLLEVPRLLPLNLHFSILPAYRGAAPVARAIADGVSETGVTLQRIVRRLDAGPVLAVERVAVDPEETAGELEARLAAVGAVLTVRTLARIARGEATETPQDEEKATRAPMLTKEEGRVDWARSAEEIWRHVRAMQPWPGARAVFSGAARKGELPVTLLSVRPHPGGGPDAPGCAPGTVTAVESDRFLVRTGGGTLAVHRLKPAGKKALTAREFANGYRLRPGDRFR